MENASKALIMAGGVLISLLVIGILVTFFNNLSDLKNMEQDIKQTAQAVEFNKKYDVYARNVYGSELFSIATMVDDYNRREADNKGYTKVELYVEFKNDFDNTNNQYNKYFKKKTYTSSDMKDEIDNLEKDKESLEKLKIEFKKTNENGQVIKTTKNIAQLASMRTIDIKELGEATSKYKENKEKYSYYKSLLSQIKQTVFKFQIFEYNENTGRIEKMYFYY